jgi:hypothetical protein
VVVVVLVRQEAVRGEAVAERGDGALLLGVADVLDGDGGGEAEVGDAPPAALLPERVDGLPPERPDLPPAPVVLGVGVAQRYLVLVGMAHCRAHKAASVPLLQPRTARKMPALPRRTALLPDIVAIPNPIS